MASGRAKRFKILTNLITRSNYAVLRNRKLKIKNRNSKHHQAIYMFRSCKSSTLRMLTRFKNRALRRVTQDQNFPRQINPFPKQRSQSRGFKGWCGQHWYLQRGRSSPTKGICSRLRSDHQYTMNKSDYRRWRMIQNQRSKFSMRQRPPLARAILTHWGMFNMRRKAEYSHPRKKSSLSLVISNRSSLNKWTGHWLFQRSPIHTT